MEKKYKRRYKITVTRQEGDSNENPNYTLKEEGDLDYLELTKDSWMNLVEEGLKSLRERGEKGIIIESETTLENLVNPLEN